MDQLLPHYLRDVIDDDLARAYGWPGESNATPKESAVDAAGVPFIRANMVSSLDGIAAIDGVSKGLSDDDDHRLFDILRDVADVVLVGAGTVRQEGYGPSELSAVRANRRQRWTGRGPLRYAVVTNGGLDPELSFFNRAPHAERPIVITTSAAAHLAPADRCEVVVAGEEKVDLQLAVDALAGMGFHHIQCEGGPGLLGSMVSVNLVDEICLSVAPLLAGRAAGPSLLGNIDLDEPSRWHLAGLHSGTNGLFARYRRGQREQ